MHHVFFFFWASICGSQYFIKNHNACGEPSPVLFNREEFPVYRGSICFLPAEGLSHIIQKPEAQKSYTAAHT